MPNPSRKPLRESVQAAAGERTLPDGRTVSVIDLAGARRISAASKAPLGRIDAQAEQMGVHPERFLRNFSALSGQEQQLLGRRRAVVIGLGGLGGVVAEILARIGIGGLTLIDGDRFEESNLNRQLMSTVDVLGSDKTTVAAERIEAVNPAVVLRLHSGFVDEATVFPFVSDADLVVDCLDSISARFALQAAARAAGKPMVSAAVAGAAGHVTTIFPEDPGLSLIYGDPEHAGDKGSEAELGTLAYAVFLLASVEASEAVKVMLGKKNLLRNRLFLVDLFENTFEVLQLR